MNKLKNEGSYMVNNKQKGVKWEKEEIIFIFLIFLNSCACSRGTNLITSINVFNNNNF